MHHAMRAISHFMKRPRSILRKTTFPEREAFQESQDSRDAIEGMKPKPVQNEKPGSAISPEAIRVLEENATRKRIKVEIEANQITTGAIVFRGDELPREIQPGISGYADRLVDMLERERGDLLRARNEDTRNRLWAETRR